MIRKGSLKERVVLNHGLFQHGHPPAAGWANSLTAEQELMLSIVPCPPSPWANMLITDQAIRERRSIPRLSKSTLWVINAQILKW